MNPRSSVVVFLLVIAVVRGQGQTLQDKLDALCQRDNRFGFVARYDVTKASNTPSWKCYYGPQLKAAGGRVCVQESGSECTTCEGVYNPIEDTASYHHDTHYGTSVSTEQAILDLIFDEVGQTFFCPGEKLVYWNSSNAGTFSIQQYTTVTWEWDSSNDFDTLGEGFAVKLPMRGIFEGTPDKTSGRLFQATIALSGSYTYRFETVGVFPYHDGVHGESMFATITVIDANECEGEGPNDCDSDTICSNVPGGYDCVEKCEGNNQCTNNAATCSEVRDGKFGCLCDDGFRGESSCRDVDECDLHIDDCEQECFNGQGNYVCVCRTGYSISQSNSSECEDNNECQLDNTLCSDDEHAFCNNLEGSFECACEEGYYNNGTSCVDVNECAVDDNGRNACDHSELCTELEGSFECTCRNGFNLLSDERSCDDINECSTSNGGCQQRCNNFEGGFECSCNVGYSLLEDNAKCGNIDECDEGSHSCDQRCEDSEGSFTCSCVLGYNMVGDSTCEETDECEAGLDDCHSLATCTNLDPIESSGEIFRCDCNAGYQGDGTECEDIDECEAGTCDSVASCNNTVGGYSCACPTGYRDESASENKDAGHLCEEIDECEEDTDNCGDNSRCVNQPGDFECECLNGFRQSSAESAAIFECEDINECLTLCDANANCGNTIGSFTCGECNLGFSGPGFTGGSCTLIENCDDHPCVHGQCISTEGCNGEESGEPGSSGCASGSSDVLGTLVPFYNSADSEPTDKLQPYACNCQGSGFSGDFCESNINECELFDPCMAHASCTDTIGSYTCTCNTGFSGDGVTNCSNINECENDDLNTCSESGKCTDTVGSFNCHCNEGYIGDGVTCEVTTYSIEMTASDQIVSVGNVLSVTLTALDVNGDVFGSENRSISVRVHTDALYRQISYDDESITFENGVGVLDFYGRLAGQYTLEIINTSRLNFNITASIVVRFAAAYVPRIHDPGYGQATVSKTLRFNNVNCGTLQETTLQSLIPGIGQYLYPGSLYEGYIDTEGRLGGFSQVLISPTNTKVTVAVGLHGSMLQGLTLTATLQDSVCGQGSDGNDLPAFDVACDGLGQCLGIATFDDVPSSDFSIQVEVDGYILTCMDQYAYEQSTLITITSLSCTTDEGTPIGYPFLFLPSDERRRQESQNTDSMNLELLISVPTGATRKLLKRLEQAANVGSTGLQTHLEDQGFDSFSNFEVSLGDDAPVVRIFGENCSNDDWSDWSDCSIPCIEGDGPIETGTSTRTKRCPLSVETRTCQPTESCEDHFGLTRCLENNGGCSQNATCSNDRSSVGTSDEAPGIVTCTCNEGFFGDGVTCTGVSREVAHIDIEFANSFTSVLTSHLDEIEFIQVIIAQLASVMSLSPTQYFSPRLESSASGNILFSCSLASGGDDLSVSVCGSSESVQSLFEMEGSDALLVLFNSKQVRALSLDTNCGTSARVVVQPTTTTASGPGSEADWQEEETMWLLTGLLIVATPFMCAALFHAAKEKATNTLLKKGVRPSTAMGDPIKSKKKRSESTANADDDFVTMKGPTHYHPYGTSMYNTNM